jgi:hypothetical protein
MNNINIDIRDGVRAMPPNFLESVPELQQFADSVVENLRVFSKVTGMSQHALGNSLCDYILGEVARKTGRELYWRVRVQLYRDELNSELAFDTDPMLAWDAPGHATFLGMQQVANHIVEVINGYHKHPCAGLDETTLDRKFKSLRSGMTRRGNGSGTCKIAYEAPEKRLRNEVTARPWIARVDVHNLDVYPLEPACEIRIRRVDPTRFYATAPAPKALDARALFKRTVGAEQ